MKQKQILIAVIVLFILSAGLYYSISYKTEGEEEFFSVESSSLENPDESNKNEDDTAEEFSKLKETNQEEESCTTKKKEICIYICGHVKKAGVYYLPENGRVSDAVELAGGFSKGAGKEQINLAKKLEDGEKIYIPSKKELALNAEESGHAIENQDDLTIKQSDAKININQAEETVLMTLPGIGKSKADAIIQYREGHGFFKQIEEIKQIEGIKDGIFEKIKDLITI